MGDANSDLLFTPEPTFSAAVAQQTVRRDNMPKSFVEVRIVNPGVRASMISGALRTWFVPEGQDFVFTSKLPEDSSVSEHLKWLHGMLESERKRLRQLQESAVATVCRIRVRARSLDIEPEALLLMHQCHLRTEISFNP